MTKQHPATEFLEALHTHDTGTGTVEIRINTPEEKMFREFCRTPDAIVKLCASAKKKSDRKAVYFGVGKRRKGAKSGRKADIESVPALFADIDTVKLGWDTDRVARNLFHLPFPLRPSILVHSGGGLHAYWLLNKPIKFGEAGTDSWKKRVKNFEKVNKTCQLLFSSDMVWDITRVLRLPGTFNTKARVEGYDEDGDPIFTTALTKVSKEVKVYWAHHGVTAGLKDYYRVFKEAAELDAHGVPGRVLGPEGFCSPEDRRGAVADDSEDYQRALTVALKTEKKDHAAGWDEIWSRCRYHGGTWPYIGIDEAAMRATAFLYCRADNDIHRDKLVEQVIQRIGEVKDADPEGKYEEWDWDEEREKVGKQLDRWCEKWDEIKEVAEKIAADMRKKKREERKAQREAEKDGGSRETERGGGSTVRQSAGG